jgi:outer membrane immunogenic protein
MRRIVVSALLLVVLSGSAVFAADLPVKAPVYQYYPGPDYYPGLDWSSFYVTGGGGGSFGKFHGALGTVGVGVNFESYSRFVVGAEADWSLENFNYQGGCTNCSFETHWLTTERARVGYSIGRTLLFATGGLAVGDLRIMNPAVGSSATTKTGYSVGGGVEVDLAQNWSVRADYLHVDLGNSNCGALCGGGIGNTSITDDVARVSIVFRFGHDTVEEFTLGGPGTKPPPPR